MKLKKSKQKNNSNFYKELVKHFYNDFESNLSVTINIKMEFQLSIETSFIINLFSNVKILTISFDSFYFIFEIIFM